MDCFEVECLECDFYFLMSTDESIEVHDWSVSKFVGSFFSLIKVTYFIVNLI